MFIIDDFFHLLIGYVLKLVSFFVGFCKIKFIINCERINMKIKEKNKL